MASIKDIGTKVENKGATAAGRLSAAEFNTLLAQVIDNTDNISALTKAKVGWAEISTNGDSSTVTFYNFKGGTQLFSGTLASASGLSSLRASVETLQTDVTQAQTGITALEDKAAEFNTSISGMDTRITALEEREEVSAMVCVITDYNLTDLTSGKYSAAELKNLANLLSSASGNVILIKAGTDTADSTATGYVILQQGTKSTNVTARTQSLTYGYGLESEYGTFTLSMASSGTYSLSVSSQSRIGSDFIRESDDTLTEVMLVLQSEDET